jgi:hypothetical protein
MLAKCLCELALKKKLDLVENNLGSTTVPDLISHVIFIENSFSSTILI